MKGSLELTFVEYLNRLAPDYIALEKAAGFSREYRTPRLGREVQHALKILLSKEQVNDLTIREVTLNKGKPGVVK